MLEMKHAAKSPFPELRGKSPEQVFAPFSEEKGAMLLLSGGETDAEYSYVCLDPAAFLVHKNGETVMDFLTEQVPVENPLECIDRFACAHGPRIEEPVFTGGAVGYISYGYRTRIEKVPDANPGAEGLPDIFFSFPSVLLVYAHTDRSWSCISLSYSWNEKPLKPGRDFADIYRTFSSYAPAPFPDIDTGSLKSDFSEEEHIRAVEKTREYIINGDIYQANIARRFSIPVSGNPYPLFLEIFRRNPAPFFSFLNCGDHYILSSSPELLLKTSGDYVESKPIKGTAPRSADSDLDTQFRNGLMASTKDEAELSMIVDLIRNDLGKICTKGSVKIKDHREMQAYSNVYHTLTTVYGKLEKEAYPSRIIKALFPGGSITGCPKIRAMEIIDEVEKSARHIYTGSIGYISARGTMELNIAIRTALIFRETLFFSAGGGIVYDSDPKKEFDETTDKAATWLEVFNPG